MQLELTEENPLTFPELLLVSLLWPFTLLLDTGQPFSFHSSFPFLFLIKQFRFCLFPKKMFFFFFNKKGTELCCLRSFFLRLSWPRLAKRKNDGSMLISKKVAKEIGINNNLQFSVVVFVVLILAMFQEISIIVNYFEILK